MALRYEAQDRTARDLANWWQTQKACVQVLHPALESSPGHAHWQSLCASQQNPSLAAGLFSVIIDPSFSQDKVDAFCDNLKRFKIGYSWGGPISLVVPYQLQKSRKTWPSHLKPGHLVRFSTGFEAVADLIEDLKQSVSSHLNF